MTTTSNNLIHVWTVEGGHKLRLVETLTSIILEQASEDNLGGDSWSRILEMPRRGRGVPHARWLAEAVRQLVAADRRSA